MAVIAPLKTISRTASFQLTVNVASVAANVAPERTFIFTGSGLKLGDAIVAVMPALEANLSISNAHVSADDTVKVRFNNPTAGAIDPASQSLYVVRI